MQNFRLCKSLCILYENFTEYGIVHLQIDVKEEIEVKEEILTDEDSQEQRMTMLDDSKADASCMTDFPDFEDEQVMRKSKKTGMEMKWAFQVFKAWQESCNEAIPCLLDMNYQQLNDWLSKFVCEARKQNGKPYSHATMYFILSGLVRYLRENDVFHYSFLDEEDTRFAGLHQVLRKRMNQPKEEAVDVGTKTADPILAVDEDKLWDIRNFSNTDAETLQMGILYYVYKFFNVRGNEHFVLKHKQFTVGKDEHGKWVQFDGTSSRKDEATGSATESERLDNTIKHYFPDGKFNLIAVLFKNTLTLNLLKSLPYILGTVHYHF